MALTFNDGYGKAHDNNHFPEVTNLIYAQNLPTYTQNRQKAKTTD